MKRKMKTQDLCMIGLFVAIIAIVAQISIPMPYGVPMSLQTFIIPLAGVILGAKRGATATIGYVILGAIGLPVFAEFSGGIGVIFGYTGGFIIGFPFMAYFAGYGTEKGGIPWLISGLLIGIIIDYSLGIAMFMLITGSSLKVAFVACVLPFIPLQIVKTILVGIIGTKCRKALIRGGLITT